MLTVKNKTKKWTSIFLQSPIKKCNDIAISYFSWSSKNNTV